MAKSVAAALLSLQQELAKPPRVFEPYKALVGLEVVSRFGTGQGTCQGQTIQHYSTPMLPPPGQTALPKRSIKFGRKTKKMSRWRKLSKSPCVLLLRVGLLSRHLDRVFPTGLLIIAMVRVRSLPALILADVAISQDFAPRTALFYVLVCRNKCLRI